jgi:hypothetical protein
MPSSPEDYWDWVLEQGRVKGPANRWTGARHATTVRTCVNLRRDGFDCEMTDEFPSEGIVITHTDFLPQTGSDTDLPWERSGCLTDEMRRAFVVCYQADRPRHPYAHIHLVQNGDDAAHNNRTVLGRLAGLDLRYLPLWTQPGLVPRRAERGAEFTNIAYFGIPEELDPVLRDPEWTAALRRRGFNLVIPDSSEWHDYSEVDAVIAVRSFRYPGPMWRKPPSKLFNAWVAGVPAILGSESAYRAERLNDLDYIEVSSRDDVDAALERLRDDSGLRQRMVANGRRRAQELDDAAMTRRWRYVLEHDVIPAYERWQRSSVARRRLWTLRRATAGRLEDAVGPLLGARRLSRDLLNHRGDWS